MAAIWPFGRDQYFLRALDVRDATSRLDFFVRNRDFLEPVMPISPELDYTLFRQRQILAQGCQDMKDDRRYLFGIFSSPISQGGLLLGYINFNNVIRGVFQSCDIGYALDQNWTGKGIMSQAVHKATEVAFCTLHLHRIQAAIMPSNKPSLRVAEKAGFQFIGLSRKHLKIHGVYQDHVLMAKCCDE